MILLSDAIAKAVKLSELRIRARDAGIAEYHCETGHGKGSRRFTWHLHCRRDVADLLLREVDELAVRAEHHAVRAAAVKAAADIRAEIANDGKFSPADFRPNLGG